MTELVGNAAEDPQGPLKLRLGNVVAQWWPQQRGRYSTSGLTGAWLIEQSEANRLGYYADLMDWLRFCRDRDVYPGAARPTDAGQWRDSQQWLSPASSARRMAAVSSWYKYLLANGADGFTYNPLTATRRPKVARDESSTISLTVDQVSEMLRIAGWLGRRQLRNYALLALLASTGLRIGEALSLDRGSRRSTAGYTVITYTAKGGKTRTRPLEGFVVDTIDTYLDARDARLGGALVDLREPLFATERPSSTHGRIRLGRMDQPAAFRLVRICARGAGVPDWNLVNPHTLRHYFATRSLELGTPLAQLQDDMGHADPRTTRGYDRARNRLAADSSLTVGRDLALHLTP